MNDVASDRRSPSTTARSVAALVSLAALGGGGVAVWANSHVDQPSAAAPPVTAPVLPSVAVPVPPASAHFLALPPRPEGALTGSALLDDLEGKGPEEAESRVLEEVRSGNVPPFLRTLVAVDVRRNDGTTDTVWVLPDYLSVGGDHDYVRVPLRAAAAERLAQEVGAVLPTPVIVDAVHRAADIKLPPRSGVGTPSLNWAAQARIHDRRVDEQLEARGAELGALVAGHMKDVVVTPALAYHPGKVAIYGMHHPDGEPVQPLSMFHVDTYVDYSQGIRLVDSGAKHDGEVVGVPTILESDEQHEMLSPAGAIRLPAYR